MSPFFKKSNHYVDRTPIFPESHIVNKYKDKQITNRLEENVQIFKEIFQKDMDFSVRTFKLFHETQSTIIYLNSLANKDIINNDVIKPLQDHEMDEEKNIILPQYIIENILFFNDVKAIKDIPKIISAIVQGKAIVFIDGIQEALEIDAIEKEKRSIEEPDTERVVRGPRDGFIEQLPINVALLRYRLPIPEFRVEETEVGTRTKTKLAVCYIEDVVNPTLVTEVKKRIDAIKIDGVLDSGYVEQFLEDNPTSPFPQLINTERPNKVVGNLLEGRIAVLMDGSPSALIAPATFNQFYHTTEDYNEHWIISSFVRFFRIIALVFSLTFSSLYVTVISFHPELIPAKYVVAASSGRQSIPLPVVVEVLLLELAMEVLREASVRMPQQVGGALSIVGVLVVGQAAVQAGFVSPISVVIIGMSTIGSFAVPIYDAANTFRMLRFLLIILAGTLGLLGLAVGLMIVVNHMLSLRSFGVPYMDPYAPLNIKALKDSIIRAPFNKLKRRPSNIHPKNTVRVGETVKDYTNYNFLDEEEREKI
ncbi:spore germination protein [Ureibacillus thermosphaericus]|uniref:spore germination protein n=1 Tax=Ureibacillus thermosphaericus TaxID=51173 RepID=UPI000BBBA9BE|nr:spore germination protein [Ureibacillus thermosphaericus]